MNRIVLQCAASRKAWYKVCGRFMEFQKLSRDAEDKQHETTVWHACFPDYLGDVWQVFKVLGMQAKARMPSILSQQMPARLWPVIFKSGSSCEASGMPKCMIQGSWTLLSGYSDVVHSTGPCSPKLGRDTNRVSLACMRCGWTSRAADCSMPVLCSTDSH